MCGERFPCALSQETKAFNRRTAKRYMRMVQNGLDGHMARWRPCAKDVVIFAGLREKHFWHRIRPSDSNSEIKYGIPSSFAVPLTIF
jgi:hypothetical protein